ncbi:MAG: hypothetical protein CMJ58_21725 [Planctomycetaceae bacterium]|nr:hypothetical protein [Planctomycetaceae bacterium]
MRAAALVVASLTLATASPATANEGYVRLSDGRQLHYTDYGAPDGRLVLFFHGTPGSCRDARIVQENLRSASIRLITPSRPGLGRSTFQPGRRILDWPCDVDQLVAAVEGPGARFSILAMSGGTPYALATARAFPDRVEQVVIASGYAPPEAPAPRTAASRSLDFIDRRPRLARLGVGMMGRKVDRKPDKVLKMVAKSWSESDRQLVLCDPELKREVIGTLKEATLCGPDGPLHDAQLLGACWGFPVAEAAGVPIAIYHGCEDEVAPVAMAHWLHGQLPGSDLTVFARAGHLSTLIWHTDEVLRCVAANGSPLAESPEPGPTLLPEPVPADSAVELTPTPAVR